MTPPDEISLPSDETFTKLAFLSRFREFRRSSSAVGQADGRRPSRMLSHCCWHAGAAMRRAASAGEYFGRYNEWHLDFTNSLEHAEFDLRPRSRQAVVPLGP